MLIADILHSCTDEGVARAAVASIGGAFAAAVRAEAERAGLSVGAFTAYLVADFARNATERDWRDISAAMSGSDHPVLTGLQALAERGLRRRDCSARLRPDRDVRPEHRPKTHVPMEVSLFA